MVKELIEAEGDLETESTVGKKSVTEGLTYVAPGFELWEFQPPLDYDRTGVNQV